MSGELSIASEHIQNNSSVRKILGERGIRPENLPPEEDIKKLERRVKKEEQLLADEYGLLLNSQSSEGDL